MKEITVDVIIPVYRPGGTVRGAFKAPGRPDPACKPVYHHEYGTGILGPVAF